MGDKDTDCGSDCSGSYNYWLAEDKKTTGQGFIIKLHSCQRWISGVQIKNKGNGYDRQCLTKDFRVSGSTTQNGPWEILVEAELEDTTNKDATLLNFTFAETKLIRFLKFDLVSYWGSSGGGLQYFAAIPVTGSFFCARNHNCLCGLVECNVTEWTSWGYCCKNEARRRRTVLGRDECKTVIEVKYCNKDECPGEM